MAVGIATKKTLGKLDLWSFDLGERGGELACSSASTLVWYLCSPRTTGASVGETTTSGTPRARIRVVGPKADDGKHLWVSHTLTRSEFMELPEADRRLFRGRIEKLLPYAPSWHFYRIIGVS